MAEWISVNDRLPENSDSVLVFGKYICGGSIDMAWCNSVTKTFYSEEESHLLDNVTHWMPLPEPPKGE